MIQESKSKEREKGKIPDTQKRELIQLRDKFPGS